METDLAFVLGIICGLLATVFLLDAWSEKRRPRAAGLFAVTSGALIYFAVAQNPGLYRLDTVPDAFVRVAAMIL